MSTALFLLVDLTMATDDLSLWPIPRTDAETDFELSFLWYFVRILWFDFFFYAILFAIVVLKLWSLQ